MPSPFPGMDPFLEQADAWQDFHQSFLPAARGAIAAQVVPDYIVKVEEHLFIREAPDDRRKTLGRADLALSRGEAAAPSRAAVGFIEAPVRAWVPPAFDVERHAFLEVRDTTNRELITVIELLSPSNKMPGPDREQYLSKRRRILHGNVHLVELDLLRGGPRLPLDGLPECDYCAIVSRWEDRPRVDAWPIGLFEPLPVVPIPLRGPDPDVMLDLRAVFDQVYDSAGYQYYLYQQTPDPRLTPEELSRARAYLPPEAD